MGEGCEQGDPLDPTLFARGQHESLARGAAALHPSDRLTAFLDDLDKPPNQRGMVVLGSPAGHPDFRVEWTVQHMAQEQELLEHLPLLPDLQCAGFC